MKRSEFYRLSTHLLPNLCRQIGSHYRRSKMIRVFLVSRYRGTTPAEIDANLERAQMLCRKASLMGGAVFASHVFYTQFLNDDEEGERTLGMLAGMEWLRACEEIWFDEGEFSKGMRAELELGVQLGLRFRRYDGSTFQPIALKEVVRLLSFIVRDEVIPSGDD